MNKSQIIQKGDLIMKKRLLITLLFAFVLVCIFAISVSAENMSVYATVRVQTNDGVWHDVYCPSERYEGRIQLKDGLYTSIDNTSAKIEPSTVITVDMSESVAYYFDGSTYKPTKAKNFFNGGAAFSNVSKVILSEDTERIRGSVCYGWTGLTEIYIPSKVYTIDDDAFRGCTNLKKVLFASDSALSNINGLAFYDCSSLESITFPATVKKISDRSFYGCTSLSSIVLSGNNNEFSINSKAFDGCSNEMVVYIVGNNASNVVSKLEGVSCFANHTTEEYTAGKAYNACFVTGYSYCEAYNSGIHTLSENYELSFTDYTTPFNEMSVCTVCDAKNKVNENDFAPIFVFAGYSVKENDNTALCGGYTVNHKSLEAYKKYNTNVSLEYGILAATPNVDGSNLLKIGENGVEATKANVIVANVDMDYVGYDFILRGFDEEGGNSDAALIICSYVSDGTNIYYLTDVCSSTAPSAITMTEIRKNSKKDNEQ